MNEEEKKAIERFSKAFEYLNVWNKELIVVPEDKKYFLTVLKLLEKKNRQIEQYQNMLATNDMLHVLESQKKDKQIDLMSNYICCMAYDKIIKKLKEDDIAYYGIEGSIKQYFERKVEE